MFLIRVSMSLDDRLASNLIAVPFATWTKKPSVPLKRDRPFLFKYISEFTFSRRQGVPTNDRNSIVSAIELGLFVGLLFR